MPPRKKIPERCSIFREARVWAEVDLDALGKNLALVRKKIAPGVLVMGVVKADAYGMGARMVAQELVECGINYLGVATLEEGIELRKAGIEVPLVIMPGICHSACAEAVRWNLTPALYRISQAGSFSRTAEKAGRILKVHLKIDTGMSRIGILPEEVPAFVETVGKLPGLELEGVFTHFAMVGLEGKEITFKQNAAFLRSVSGIANPGLLHAANSSAILLHKETHHHMVRPGLVLYGCRPWEGCREKITPVLSLKARITQIKTIPTGTGISYGGTYLTEHPTRIAILPIGYADGYRRLLSNKGWALIHGRKAPVVGRICMDMTIVDVTAIPGVEEGDEAVLLGRSASEELTTEQLAQWAQTVSYEILTGIGRRIPRFYRKNGRLISRYNSYRP